MYPFSVLAKSYILTAGTSMRMQEQDSGSTEHGVGLKKDATKVLVCIPAYNEAIRIGEIVKRARAYASEVIVCDDGSTDDTAREAQAAGATVIRHRVNKGYGSALKTLFRIAKEKNADVMVTIDADGQHDPDQIPNLLEPVLREGFDIVIGSRFLNTHDREKVPSYRSFGIKTLTLLTKIASNRNITDSESGFRAYGKTALSKIQLQDNGFGAVSEILLRASDHNLSIKEVPATISYDTEGTSTMNPLSHGTIVLTSIILFVSLRHPLLFYGAPGIIMLVVSAGFLTQALAIFSETRYVSTNLILVALGAAFIGVTLLITCTVLVTVTALLREKMRDT
jgi:glycosyltransferase involved in cell wall biosynthesis